MCIRNKRLHETQRKDHTEYANERLAVVCSKQNVRRDKLKENTDQRKPTKDLLLRIRNERPNERRTLKEPDETLNITAMYSK